MAEPIFAQGTALQMSDTDSNYTTIAHVGDFPFPDGQRDLIEVTDHDSPSGFEEHILGLTRTGEIAFKVWYIPSDPTHDDSTGLIAARDAGTLKYFQIVMTDADSTIWKFQGRVRRFMPNAPVNGAYQADVSIKPSGATTYA